jgi:hypothetical protein
MTSRLRDLDERSPAPDVVPGTTRRANSAPRGADNGEVGGRYFIRYIKDIGRFCLVFKFFSQILKFKLELNFDWYFLYS